MQPPPLLAIDLEGLLPFLFVVFWIVSQVFAAIKRAGQGAAPPPGRPRPVAGPARPPQNADEARREMARQIEDFLRQASGQERPFGRPPQPPARPQQPRQPTALPAGRPSAGQARPQRSAPPAQRKPVGKTPAVPTQRPATGTAKLEPQVGAAPITTLKPSLAERDAGGGERETVERHVREAFSRDLPHLAADAADTPRPAVATAAESLVKKLRDPATIRDLVILREVLDRPVDRW